MKMKLITIGKKELNRELFQPVQNNLFFTKPGGGLWASPLLRGEFVSAWHEWCVHNYYNRLNNDSVVFNLKPGTRVCTIANQKDLGELLKITGSRKIDPDEMIFSLIRQLLDFEAIAQQFDVLYLTKQGEVCTRYPLFDEPSLYGWDCESCLILNFDCIDNWKYRRLSLVKKRLYEKECESCQAPFQTYRFSKTICDKCMARLYQARYRDAAYLPTPQDEAAKEKRANALLARIRGENGETV
jgi:hypothetical protein